MSNGGYLATQTQTVKTKPGAELNYGRVPVGQKTHNAATIRKCKPPEQEDFALILLTSNN